MEKHVRRTKIDWFDEHGNLKQTFNSYEHSAKKLKIEYNNENINEYIIRSLIKNNCKLFCTLFRKIIIIKNDEIIQHFKNNIEFMNFYKINNPSKTSNIINGKIKFKKLEDCEIKVIKNNPDLRLHIYKNEENTIEKICTLCDKSKPFTKEFYYIYDSGRYEVKCKKCCSIRTGDKHIKIFKSNLNSNWKNHPDFDYIYFERDTEKIFNIKSGKYLTTYALVNITHISTKILKWESFYGKIPENKIIKLKENESIILDNLECVYVYCQHCNKLIEKPFHINQLKSLYSDLDFVIRNNNLLSFGEFLNQIPK